MAHRKGQILNISVKAQDHPDGYLFTVDESGYGRNAEFPIINGFLVSASGSAGGVQASGASVGDEILSINGKSMALNKTTAEQRAALYGAAELHLTLRTQPREGVEEAQQDAPDSFTNKAFAVGSTCTIL